MKQASNINNNKAFHSSALLYRITISRKSTNAYVDTLTDL